MYLFQLQQPSVKHHFPKSTNIISETEDSICLSDYTWFHLPSSVEMIQAYRQAKLNLRNKQVIPDFDSTELGSNYT